MTFNLKNISVQGEHLALAGVDYILVRRDAFEAIFEQPVNQNLTEECFKLLNEQPRDLVIWEIESALKCRENSCITINDIKAALTSLKAAGKVKITGIDRWGVA